MKNFITLFAIAAIAWSCQTEQTSDLNKLYQERDSLVAIQSTIGARLRDIETELSTLDSTRSLTTVTTMPLVLKSFDHYFQVYGTIEASKSINLFPEANGTIERIYVTEGQKVTEGQLLIELDGKLIQKNIEELEVNLDLAKSLYEKQRKLWVEEKIGSEVQYLQAKTNKESLESRLALLQQQMRMTKVRAPFSGVVDEIFPKTGEMAMAGQPVLRLINLSEVYLSADVSEAYVGTVGNGTAAEVYISSLDKTIPSKVIQVGQFINPGNRTFRVHVGLDEQSSLYKPNMMASINLRDYHADSTIVIPNRLIQQTPQGLNFVYIAKPYKEGFGEVKRIMVEVGKSYKEFTEVKEGLSADDVLIDRGSRSVKDGQHVQIVKP
jgi:RND family efflux transporter MFP subunit